MYESPAQHKLCLVAIHSKVFFGGIYLFFFFFPGLAADVQPLPVPRLPPRPAEGARQDDALGGVH